MCSNVSYCDVVDETGEMSTIIKNNPIQLTHDLIQHEDICQVILHNDDRNTVDHVVYCLVKVFGHGVNMAVRIMTEAHKTGKSIAEVESETEAQHHRDQLQSYGLSATVEKI